MKVSFTKIRDDVLVPTQLYEAKDGFELKKYPLIFYCFAGLWLFLAILYAKDGLVGLAVVTGAVVLLAAPLILILKLPYGWIELNREDGTVTVWTSVKKRRRVAKCLFTDMRIDWAKRYMQTSRYSAEYRYSLGLYQNKGKKKYYKTLIDGKQEAQFCFIYDMETCNTKRLPLGSLEHQAEIVTRKAETFLNDFFAGKQLPARKDNTYVLSI